jgi:hypothetical protein
MASHTGSSIVKASGSQASIEGAYRFLRNDDIAIAETSKATIFDNNDSDILIS